MIKAFMKAESTGRGAPMILLGLSRGNMDKLLAGQPILVMCDQVAAQAGEEIPKLAVAIIGGETEESMFEELKREGFAFGHIVDERDKAHRPECTASNPCCDRRDEYNGYASGPLLFKCPKSCPCHD